MWENPRGTSSEGMEGGVKSLRIRESRWKYGYSVFSSGGSSTRERIAVANLEGRSLLSLWPHTLSDRVKMCEYENRGGRK